MTERVHCIDCDKPIDRQAYRCRDCARVEFVALRKLLPKPPKRANERRGKYVRTPLPGESPHRLARAGWAKHGLIWRHDGTAA